MVDQTRDEIYNIARQTMPEIRSSQLKIESSQYAVRAARGNLYPRLSLNGAFNTNYSSISEKQYYPGALDFSATPVGYLNKDLNSPIYTYGPTPGEFRNTNTYDKQFKNNIYKTLSLQLTIPIFNNYSARASLRRSVIQSHQAEINAKEISNTLRQNVETAYNDAVSAAKTYNSSLRQVQAREEAFRMMNQRYSAGAATSFEFQVSQNSLYQAKTDLSRAKYNFIFKKKVLDFYQGKSIEY
jgi:outer membrane protein